MLRHIVENGRSKFIVPLQVEEAWHDWRLLEAWRMGGDLNKSTVKIIRKLAAADTLPGSRSVRKPSKPRVKAVPKPEVKYGPELVIAKQVESVLGLPFYCVVCQAEFSDAILAKFHEDHIHPESVICLR